MIQQLFSEKFKEFKSAFFEILMIKVLIEESQYLIKLISHNLWITRKVNEHALTAKKLF